MKPLVTLSLFLIGATTASAAVHGVALGVNPPPAMLGPWGLSPTGADTRGIPDFVSSVELLPGAGFTFDQPVSHTRVGADWGSWSLGYEGDVYYTTLSADPYSLDIDLGSGLPAVYFYAQPDAFDLVDISAEASDGTDTAVVSQLVDGFGGAAGFGFHADPGSVLRSIRITVDPASGAGGFAIGHLGTVPEARTWLASAMLALAVGSAAWRRFRP